MITGDCKTPEEIIKLLKEAVSLKGQRSVSRESGIPLLSIQRYLKGIGEPTLATFQKLSNYFDITFMIEIKPQK